MRTATITMFATTLLLATASTLVAWVAPPVRSDGYVGPECSTDIQPVCDAQMTALGEALQSDNRSVRHQALMFLCGLGTGFDPRPLRAALARYDELEHSPSALRHVDEYELAISSREDRVRVYHRAIADGGVRFGVAGVLRRDSAITQAAREGLTELEPLIERVFPEMGDTFQQQNPLRYLQLSLKLHEGAQTSADAGATAVKRLAAIPPQELCDSLRADPTWRRLVVEANMDVCRGQAPEACDLLKKAVDALQPILLQARAQRRSQQSGQGAAAGQDEDEPVWGIIRDFYPR
jgi:hypothetical protein